MRPLKSLLGRRRFLIDLFGSALVLASRLIITAPALIFKTNPAKASEKLKDVEKKALQGIVVYYSATGSTGKIAGAIHRGMNSVIECDIAPINKIDPKEITRYDVVAIGGPVWYFRETANLRLFVHHLPHMAGKLCILFCSHGTQPSGFFFSLAQVLVKKAFTIIGWNDWYGDATHVLHMPQPYTTHGHPDEIDLREAETFGREMAERAVHIYDGRKDFIPEIPAGPDADPLWITAGHEMQTEAFPRIETETCVYPRCTACVENCPANAINFSLTAPAVRVSGSPVFFEGCLQCGKPLCERSCSYDAISYPEQTKTEHVIKMSICTYPKCTLCADNCPMRSIDFSKDPPVFHNNCEGCDLCWCICPENAIDIPNLSVAHGSGLGPGVPFFHPPELERAIEEGRFRPLIDIHKMTWDNMVSKNPNAPRVVLREENYPYSVK